MAKLTDAQVDRIVKLRDAGDTFRTIAEKLGIATTRGRAADTGGRAYAAYWTVKRGKAKPRGGVTAAEAKRLKKNAAERARKARIKAAVGLSPTSLTVGGVQ